MTGGRWSMSAGRSLVFSMRRYRFATKWDRLSARGDLSLGPSARSYADCHRDARLWFPSQAKLRRDEDVRTEGDADANAARRRGFARRECREHLDPGPVPTNVFCRI